MADSLDALITRMTDTDYLYDEIQFKINENLRTVTVPKAGVVLGVLGDKNINRVNFQMPRYYNGFDMSEFDVRVVYSNANGVINYYTVTDLIIDDNDTLLFTWLVNSDATAYVGNVMFTVQMLKSENDVLTQSFSTTVAKAKVLTGLSVEANFTPEQKQSLIVSLERYVDNRMSEITTDLTTEQIAEVVDEKLADNTISTETIDKLFIGG